MELPAELLGSVAQEGDIYFFEKDCPVGVANHMHVCVKHADKFVFLSACSSQIDTAMRLCKLKGYDLNTMPVFTSNEENKFKKAQTYINCNHLVELSEEHFGELVQRALIRKVEGNLNELDLELIAKGIKASPDIEHRVKALF